MAAKFKISDYLYTSPHRDTYTEWVRKNELRLYFDEPIIEEFFGEFERCLVNKVTKCFVYVHPYRWASEICRLDRELLEQGIGVRPKKIGEKVYVWDAIKDKYEEQRQRYRQILENQRPRIEQDKKRAAEIGFKCERCNFQAKRVAPGREYYDDCLYRFGYGINVTTPYDGKFVCKSCQKELFKKYYDAV